MVNQLKHPPLIEALMEIKWELQKKGPDTFIDPGYKLANGRLYDRIKDKFSYIEQLPIENINFPEELTTYSVRTQFRAKKNAWPLVQFGPGIASINFSSPYSWDNFKGKVEFVIPQLLDSYKGIGQDGKDIPLKIKSGLLRFINAQDFNWENENILEYIESNLHTRIELPKGISDSESIIKLPNNVVMQIGYLISKPEGQVFIRISTGLVGQIKKIIWELLFISKDNYAPQLDNMNEFIQWLTEAHEIIEKCFFSLIDGALLKKYQGDWL